MGGVLVLQGLGDDLGNVLVPADPHKAVGLGTAGLDLVLPPLGHAAGDQDLLQLALGLGLGKGVDLRQSLADISKKLSVFRPHRLKLRLEGVGRKLPHIVRKGCVLYVQLLFNDFLIKFRKSLRRFNEHIGDGLTVLDVGRISGRASHNDDL